MNRVTTQAMSSMSRLMFQLVEHNNIYDENYELQIHPLNNRQMPDEFLVTEVQEFLEQIFMLFIDIEENFSGALNELETTKKILTRELVSIDSFPEPQYIERLSKFVNTCQPYDLIKELFQGIIQRAKEQRMIRDKFLENPKEHLGNLTTFIEDVVQIYKEANGEPNPKPSLFCPICNKQTINYGCAWGYNNHVHFHCEHCEMRLAQ